MRFLSKGLQVLGLLIVGQALLVGLMEETNPMTKELTLMFLGAMIFWGGYWLEG